MAISQLLRGGIILKSFRSSVAIGALLGMFTASAYAQVSGRLTGTVVDPTQAVVPNADIQLMLPGGKSPVATATTTTDGIFAFIGVRPGTYEVNVTAKGFMPAKLENVQVSPITETSLPPVQLSVQAVSQTVDVTATLQTIQTTNAEVTTTVTTKQFDQLPILDRGVLQFALTQAGVGNASSISNGNDTVVNGLRSTYLNVTLDGINIQD